MKEQRTKQILICLAASLGCFWLGNRAGLLYVSAVGTVTQRLAAAVNLSKIVLHPLQLSSAPIPVPKATKNAGTTATEYGNGVTTTQKAAAAPNGSKTAHTM